MNDTDRFPLYEYTGKSIVKSPGKRHIPGWNFHHYVEKKLLKKYPDLIQYQKLILIPCNMNYDINNRTRSFEKRWGIKLEEVVYIK